MDLPPKKTPQNGGTPQSPSSRRSSRPRILAGDPTDFSPPFQIQRPKRQLMPFVFNSPHSGRHYPTSFLKASNLDPISLRRSEDSFVEELFAGVVELGAPLLHANFPRAFLDVNREPYELDPAMFSDMLPPHVNTRSVRVASGLGTIPRVVTDSTEIYRNQITYAEADLRIKHLYLPFHEALRSLLQETMTTFGCAVLIDCHSMPSLGLEDPADNNQNDSSNDIRPDIVLGDRYATSCSPELTDIAERTLQGLGYSVSRNNPYAGGFNTEHYGRPAQGLHAMQIEINRALYMDEKRISRLRRLKRVKKDMSQLAHQLGAAAPNFLIPPRQSDAAS